MYVRRSGRIADAVKKFSPSTAPMKDENKGITFNQEVIKRFLMHVY